MYITEKTDLIVERAVISLEDLKSMKILDKKPE